MKGKQGGTIIFKMNFKKRKLLKIIFGTKRQKIFLLISKKQKYIWTPSIKKILLNNQQNPSNIFQT